MLRKNKYLIFVSVILMLLLFAQIPAMADVHFGVRTGYYTNAEDAFVGGEFITPITKQVFFNPNVEYVFYDPGNYMTLNGDFHYDFATRGTAMVWAGGGLGLRYKELNGASDSNWNAGLDLLFGLGLRTSNGLIPYVQGKAFLADDNEFSIGFGLRF
jgi:hypothetical protein